MQRGPHRLSDPGRKHQAIRVSGPLVHARLFRRVRNRRSGCGRHRARGRCGRVVLAGEVPYRVVRARVDRRLRWHDVYSQGRDEGFSPWRSAKGRGKRPGLVRPGEQRSLANKWVRESYVPCNSYKLVCFVYRSFELENANVPLRAPNPWTEAWGRGGL